MSNGRKLATVRFHSRSLGQERSHTIMLPLGYAAAAARGTRFPVLYLLHDTSGSPRLPAFARRLRAAGADVREVMYPGHHDWRLWRGQIAHMLTYAGGELWRGR